MQHVAKAYGAVAKEIASPRDLEANLLLKAAARLQAVHDGWGSDRSDLDGALLYNRKLWTIFLDAAMTGESPMPAEIRQNIANLGMFVLKQTMSITTDPKQERLPPLISINREIAAGLRGQG
jgi:flagellar biosynthesis activator protein FlaF